jgi:hypothetical protein
MYDFIRVYIVYYTHKRANYLGVLSKYRGNPIAVRQCRWPALKYFAVFRIPINILINNNIIFYNFNNNNV